MVTNNTYHFCLADDLIMKEAVNWTLKVFGQYAGVEIALDEGEGAVSVGYKEGDVIRLSKNFWERIKNGNYSTDGFNPSMVLNDGDLLGSAFYFINCLWERESEREKDDWGRSKFSNSIWKEFGHDKPFCHVNTMFDTLATSIGVTLPTRKSSVFLSHDVDAVFSAWQEDGKAALKKGKLAPLFKGVKDQLTGNPAWFNFEEIVNLELSFGAKSTFYWITTEKPVPGIGKNADYKILSPQMQDVVKKLTEMGASHGIHKSIDTTSLKEEVGQIGMTIDSNRYHYLKYAFEDLVNEVNSAGLKMDASLGYAEVHGYRNGYSLPFIPFDIVNNSESDFIEVPLVIMDATFSRYHKMKGDEASKAIRDFMKEHEKNAVISILWHNTHFTDFKYEGYPQVYEDILNYIKTNEIETVSPSDLIDKYLN